MAPQGVPAGEGGVPAMRVKFPHGFFEADGTHRAWLADQIVDDAAEIEMLRARGVELQEK
ncbi:hypothetical protein [Lichenicoccus sp.]|uniref:hypothetical protein n=1 Tax=Lichenicoccus sp. TaxID=2781899 RepID=UPI003D12CA76